MTIHVSLDSPEAGPSTPKYVHTSIEPQEDLKSAIWSVRESKRIVVVSGAGVSTGANIPDFRSSSGLFSDGSMVKGKGKAKGEMKDLFHVRCLSSPTLLAAHHALITSLASLAIAANPTPFHSYLSSLASLGRLLRCYTQNIDALEEKAGLRIGIPSLLSKKTRSRSGSKEKPATTQLDNDLFDPLLFGTDINSQEPELDPQVIPLHGLLNTLKCTLCSTTLPIEPYLPLPNEVIHCPTCKLTSTIREALSERKRPMGRLRSNIILYGEEHPQSELIGKNIEKDLKLLDCLIVLGTSLSVPGIKRLVKEMSKSLNHRKSTKNRKGNAAEMGRVILVNNEFPKGDWKDIFDYWIQMDIQDFVVNYLTNQDYATTSEPERKDEIPITPKKNLFTNTTFPPTPESLDKSRSRSKSKTIPIEDGAESEHEIDITTPTKTKRRREVEVVLPSPISIKRSKYVKMQIERRDRESTPTPLPS